uniref:Uncharacterized protein n=1 Tax=Romanomermis culicivorax TaxID=13658 RepID=A0A915J3W8_ROMCU
MECTTKRLSSLTFLKIEPFFIDWLPLTKLLDVSILADISNCNLTIGSTILSANLIFDNFFAKGGSNCDVTIVFWIFFNSPKQVVWGEGLITVRLGLPSEGGVI